ncbi:hypothetical protein DM02DRAFT_82564 [Periconia macrospinosa]|uniref:Transmembrane protein n=1 Tax=Periconia macrospinosa TaxID=97972 RepID=A0A2V1DH63_9PLEO|nr:hypothetical protein DM02DRAFT_82564 [Periconia macrospinosa]
MKRKKKKVNVIIKPRCLSHPNFPPKNLFWINVPRMKYKSKGGESETRKKKISLFIITLSLSLSFSLTHTLLSFTHTPLTLTPTVYLVNHPPPPPYSLEKTPPTINECNAKQQHTRIHTY